MSTTTQKKESNLSIDGLGLLYGNDKPSIFSGEKSQNIGRMVDSALYVEWWLYYPLFMALHLLLTETKDHSDVNVS